MVVVLRPYLNLGGYTVSATVRVAPSERQARDQR